VTRGLKPGAGPTQSAAPTESKALRRTFEVSLILKGLDGIAEVIGGTLLLIVSPRAIAHLSMT
jgi:uncharacterized membrane protein